MTSRIFSLFTQKKKIRSSGDPHLSMIDFISDEPSMNDSFRSQQPNLETSFSAFNSSRNLTEASPKGEDFHIKKQPRANISSVFNTPKRTSLVEDLTDLLQEHVIYQLGDMIRAPKNKAPSYNVAKIHASDFDVYIAKLKNSYEKYRKINASRLKKAKAGEKVNAVETLMQCYQKVSSQYFDQDFFFNFEYLTKDRAKVMSAQEELGEDLDIVELNLYYQITDKFQAFLDVILKLNQMEAQIQNSLYSIKILKDSNKDLKIACSNRVTKTLALKRKKTNIEKTLGLMELINVVRKTLPTLVLLIQRNNIESAVRLIKTSEETYKNKLKQIKPLKNFGLSFNEARTTLEKMLTGEFEDRCINYMSPAFSYNKASLVNASNEISMVEESFMNVSAAEFTGGLDEDGLPVTHLYWTLGDCPTSLEAENNIAKIVLEYIKIKNFPLTVYKAKLSELIKKFHQQFMRDMEEYCAHNLPRDDVTNPSSPARFDLNIKFTLFYLQIFKRFISRHFKLNNRILTILLNYYNKAYVEKPEQLIDPNTQVLDVKAMKNLNETVQEFYLVLENILKTFSNKIMEIIELNNVAHITVNQFAKLSTVFHEITRYFDSELQLNKNLNSWIVSDKEGIRKPLMNLLSTLSDKINIVTLKTLKIDYERKFITAHYKQKHEELKQSLEQESWQPADIPYTYSLYFNLFFGIGIRKENKVPSRKASEDMLRLSRNNLDESNVNEDGSILVEDLSKIEESLKNNKVPEEIFSIKKNEIFVNNMRFKTTTSFLLLIKIIYENFNIALRFSSIGSESISKVFEIIKFYNSYCIQLVLGAGATTFGKVKKITAKVLALSSVSLSLLVQLIEPLNVQILEHIENVNQEWLKSESAKVKSDLNQHINEITSKIRVILKTKLIEQCNELKRISWSNAQEKVNIPTKCSASVLHNTRQMYKTIEDYLSKEHLIAIFNVVFSDIKENFLPIFQNMNVETQLAAKRIKEELKYFCDDLYQIPIFQAPELKYGDFEDKIFAILEEKCNHYLEATFD